MKNLLFILCLAPFFLFAQEKGNAGVYADDLHGRKTANGQVYNKNEFSASHKTIPFNTWIRIKNISNGKMVDVKVNDRGPYTGNRVVDLSDIAARKISLLSGEITQVEIEVLGTAYQPKNDAVEVMPVFKKRAQENKKALEGKRDPEPQVVYKSKTHKQLMKNTPITKNLMSIDLYPSPKEGFGVQVGIFSSFENIYMQMSSLPKKYQLMTLVKAVKSNGKTKYKLILGPFNSKQKAADERVKIKKWVKDCIVIGLDTL